MEPGAEELQGRSEHPIEHDDADQDEAESDRQGAADAHIPAGAGRQQDRDCERRHEAERIDREAEKHSAGREGDEAAPSDWVRVLVGFALAAQCDNRAEMTRRPASQKGKKPGPIAWGEPISSELKM